MQTTTDTHPRTAPELPATGGYVSPAARVGMDPIVRRAQQRRRRILGLTAFWAFTAAVVAGVARAPQALTAATEPSWWASVGRSVADGWRTAVLNPWYWLAVVVLVVAERLLPARRDEGTLNVGGAQDLAWTILAPIVSLTAVAVTVGAFNAAWDHLLGGLGVDLTPWLGPIGVAVLAFAITDFGMWFTHWARHKVPTFWHFHAVHHAPTRMNPLVDNRVHFVEPIVSAALLLVPARLLGLEGHATLALALATTYFTAFIHANLRTNLGPLRYVLISPQAHRVHHSYAPEHIDTNFGTVLSVWDRIFGTYYRGEDEYPTVGIPDSEFPLESSAAPMALLAGVARQTAYPFRQCIDDIGRYRRTTAG